jgi:hypothetical protein
MYRHPIRFSIISNRKKKKEKRGQAVRSLGNPSILMARVAALFADCHRFQNGVGPHIFKGRVHFDSDCERHFRRRIEKGTVETFSSHHFMRQGNSSSAGISVRAALRNDRFFFSKWNSIDL